MDKIKSADRTLDVLELLADNADLSAKEVCDQLAIPKSSGHALLRRLESRNYVSADPQNRYRLGVGLRKITSPEVLEPDLLEYARPIVDKLADLTRETVHLAVLDDRHVLYLYIKHSPHALRLVSRVGVRLPAQLTGIGKAALSRLDDQQVRLRFNASVFEQLTHRSIRDIDALVAEVSQARSDGYAFDDEESNLGVQCIAAPLALDGPPAAISISAPTARMQREAFGRLLMRGLKSR